MSDRGLAVAAYIPVPGLAFILVRLAPDSRFVRYHGLQGAWMTLTAYTVLLLLGLLVSLTDVTAFGAAGGVVLAAALMAMAVGMLGAATGRYPRIRPIWDLLRLRPSRRPRLR